MNEQSRELVENRLRTCETKVRELQGGSALTSAQEDQYRQMMIRRTEKEILRLRTFLAKH